MSRIIGSICSPSLAGCLIIFLARAASVGCVYLWVSVKSGFMGNILTAELCEEKKRLSREALNRKRKQGGVKCVRVSLQPYWTPHSSAAPQSARSVVYSQCKLSLGHIVHKET